MVAAEVNGVTNEMRELRNQLLEAMVVAGNCIEKLDELGCRVDVEVWYDGGGDSQILNKLNGEFETNVNLCLDVGGG